MSTFGRAADRAVELERQWRRRLEAKKIGLSHAINFAINTLAEASIADSAARVLTLKVLVRWRP
jgi:hypothetical protein